MAREFKIKLSDDLSEADIYLAIRARANELMMEGDLGCWLKIEVEAIEGEIIDEGDLGYCLKVKTTEGEIIDEGDTGYWLRVGAIKDEIIDEQDKIDDETRCTLKDIIDSAIDIAGADIEMDMIDDCLEEKYKK